MDTLTRMRAFVDVVEAEGYSAAARKIGRSKALLSKYVRELEDDLGALLLNRTTRQFSLTEAGHTYYKRASELIREIDSLRDVVRDSSGDASGRMKLSASRTFADAPIGRSLVDFSLAYPDIKLDVSLDDRFVDLIEEGFDVAIRIARLDDSSMIARRIAPFRTRICVSPQYLKIHGTPEIPQDLANHPCLIDTNGRWRTNWPFINKDGETIAVQVDGPIEANSPLLIREAAISGLGIAIIPDFVAAPSIESGELVAILDDWVPGDAGIYAVYPHRRYLPAKVRVFVDFLAKWFRNHDPSGQSPQSRP